MNATQTREGSQFRRGSGCYTCRSCGRATRDTGRGDNEGVELCAECYDLAGIENAIQDNGKEAIAEYAVEARQLWDAILEKGGQPSFEFAAECGIPPPSPATPLDALMTACESELTSLLYSSEVVSGDNQLIGGDGPIARALKKQAPLPFADMADDLDGLAAAPVQNSKTSYLASHQHPFEAAGLGASPYKCIGVTDEENGACQFCGQRIRYRFAIASADGREFNVGSDCVKRVNEQVSGETTKFNIAGFAYFDKQLSRKKAVARKIAEGRNLIARRLKWKEEHAGAHRFIVAKAGKGSAYFNSLLNQLESRGRLSELQMKAIDSSIIDDVHRAIAREYDQILAAKTAPKVESLALETAFAKAKVSGLKYPRITLNGLTFKPAGPNSKSPGAIFVTRGREFDGAYLGKVMGGKFLSAFGCPDDVASNVAELMNDPLKTVTTSGQMTGHCAICSRLLVDPVSVARGIGPICAENFGW